MAHVSSYLTRPLRSEAQAREDRQRREAQETLAPALGLLQALLMALAVNLALMTLLAFLLGRERVL